MIVLELLNGDTDHLSMCVWLWVMPWISSVIKHGDCRETQTTWRFARLSSLGKPSKWLIFQVLSSTTHPHPVGFAWFSAMKVTILGMPQIFGKPSSSIHRRNPYVWIRIQIPMFGSIYHPYIIHISSIYHPYINHIYQPYPHLIPT